MKKGNATLMILAVIVLFAAYMVYDTGFRKGEKADVTERKGKNEPDDMWTGTAVYECKEGNLKAVAAGDEGLVYLGGESFISAIDTGYKLLWTVKPGKEIYSLACLGDTVIAATREELIIYDRKGKLLDEWGPFEDSAIITSVAMSVNKIAFADAGNKIVMVLDREGRVNSIIGLSGKEFIVPSPYFDVALKDDGTLYVANTGHRRVETRDAEGAVEGMFGEPGTAPGSFCGCCNPAHFALIPGGFVTAEKGINRIKILGVDGSFTEYVSSENDFFASVPLDVASFDGKIIYGANPVDSKLYSFKRK